MISHSPLTHNYITLPCKHSFNYIPLYKELSLHNNKNTIVCPYCRSSSDKFIPFIPLPGIVKIVGVNSPTKLCMPAPECTVILKTGLNKGNICGGNGMVTDTGIYCEKHKHYMNKDIWTTEMEKLSKQKSVSELKEMLRKRKLKVGGVKKELVKRLLL